MPVSIALPTSERPSGWKYSAKIETMSIFIGCISSGLMVIGRIVLIIQQAGDIDDRQAASLKIDLWHQCCHEGHEPNPSSGIDLEHILRRQMQHGTDRTDVDAVRRSGFQANQLPIVERVWLRRPLIAFHSRRQERA